jgi:hypothetical protein
MVFRIGNPERRIANPKSLSRYALWHRRLACVSTGGTPVPQVFGISPKSPIEAGLAVVSALGRLSLLAILDSLFHDQGMSLLVRIHRT